MIGDDTKKRDLVAVQFGLTRPATMTREEALAKVAGRLGPYGAVETVDEAETHGSETYETILIEVQPSLVRRLETKGVWEAKKDGVVLAAEMP